MRKILIFAALIVAAFSCTAFAASSYYSTKVVIIGGGEFKTSDYYKIIEKTLGAKSRTRFECGNEVQKRYQMFIMDRYDIGENKPHKRDFVDFAARNGYGKVLFIIVDENIDTQNNANRRQKNRSTIQMDAYLASGSAIVDFSTTSQEYSSKTSNLRARRGAFEKCLKDISVAMHL